MAKFRMSEAQIARLEKDRLTTYLLDEAIGEINLKNYKLDSDNAIAKEVLAMPNYKGVFSLRSMRRYVNKRIEDKILDLEWDRRIDELPAGSNWPLQDSIELTPEMKKVLREKVLETLRYEAAHSELSFSKEYWELSPKELRERAMQRAKRPQS
jgi:hypothetical protein